MLWMSAERAMGIEPTSEPWQGPVLPLNHARSSLITKPLKKSAQEGTRTLKPCGIRPSNVRVCHSATWALRNNASKNQVRVGIEPTNRSFADCSLSHLGTAPLKSDTGRILPKLSQPNIFFELCSLKSK